MGGVFCLLGHSGLECRVHLRADGDHGQARLQKDVPAGFGLLGVSPMWVPYNPFVPVFLQAGAPGFEGT